MASSSRHSDNDGSDIFWPGYVDATTNLILNLLFLLTILIVAVFMFALELGRSTQFQTDNPPITSLEKDLNLSPQAALGYAEEAITDKNSDADQEARINQEIDLALENLKLKREIERLNTLLVKQASQYDQGGGVAKTVEATINVPKARSGVDKTLATDAEVLVRFKHEAIDFTEGERELLQKSLEPIVASGQATISVEVPAGFSEAKRLGYYRAMAVRNLLIEMQLSGPKIDVSVIEVEDNANASLVTVRTN